MAQHQKNENPDFISQIPAPIIHHILTLLDSNKDCARTSVLSKTWKILYDSRPNLVFNEQDFVPLDSCVSSPRTRALFVDCVDRSLDRCIETNPNVNLESFELKLSMADLEGKPLSQDVNTWLEKAFALGVKTMSLTLGTGYYLKKQLVIESMTLVQLHLSCFRFLKACEKINLPNVKILSLFHVDLRKGSLEKLISGCPSVEFFHLSQCRVSEDLQLSGLAKLVEVTLSYCTTVKTVEIVSPFFQNFLHLDYGKKSGSSAVTLLGCEKVTKLQLSTWITGEFCEFKWLVELRLVCLVVKGVISSQSVRRLVMRFCKAEAEMAEIDCPNLLSLEYEDNEMPFRLVSACNPRDFRYEFSLPANGRSVKIDALQMLFSTTFFATQNFKVVIVLGHQKDVIILDGLIEVMISILNQVGELLHPRTFITSGSIDWNAILPFSHPKADHLAVNVVSLCDSTFPKVVWEKFLSLKESQTGCYGNVSCIKKDYGKENIPVELQQDQFSLYQVSRIIMDFDWSRG